MSEENEDGTTNESEAKPTITIAEKQGGATEEEKKPTITIAEKDGGE